MKCTYSEKTITGAKEWISTDDEVDSIIRIFSEANYTAQTMEDDGSCTTGQ